MNKFGIISYGVNIPEYRIRVEEIAKVWGQNAVAIKKGSADILTTYSYIEKEFEDSI